MDVFEALSLEILDLAQHNKDRRSTATKMQKASKRDSVRIESQC